MFRKDLRLGLIVAFSHHKYDATEKQLLCSKDERKSGLEQEGEKLTEFFFLLYSIVQNVCA